MASVKVKEPIVFQIANKTWLINEFGMDAMFLLEGDEKALLIDTGTGTFNVKALVEKLTDKPLMVALTHGHVDHAGGMKWFEDVWLHEDDFEMARTLTQDTRRHYAGMILGLSGDFYDHTEDDVVDGPCTPVLHALKENDVIHLGNRDLVVYETPGHTLGSISFLDVKERIIYTGDACNVNTLLVSSADSDSEKATVSSLLKTAEKIESLHPYYDRNYNGHIGYASMITRMDPMAECLTRDAIALCKDLLSGAVKGEETMNPFRGKCLLARRNTMQIVYKEKQLR